MRSWRHLNKYSTVSVSAQMSLLTVRGVADQSANCYDLSPSDHRVSRPKSSIRSSDTDVSVMPGKCKTKTR